MSYFGKPRILGEPFGVLRGAAVTQLLESFTQDDITPGTQLVADPEAFGAWTLTRASVDANADDAPDGSTTADGLIASTDDNTHVAGKNITSISAETAYTFSVFLKAGAATWVELDVDDYETGNYLDSHAAYFDLAAPAVGATPVAVNGTDIVAYPDGWIRCSIRFTTTATTTNIFAFISIGEADGDKSFAGDNSSTYLTAWGAKVAQEASLSAYEAYTRWYASADSKPRRVTEDGTPLAELTVGDLMPGTWWWDSGNSRVYVRTTGDDSPAGYTLQATL